MLLREPGARCLSAFHHHSRSLGKFNRSLVSMVNEARERQGGGRRGGGGGGGGGGSGGGIAHSLAVAATAAAEAEGEASRWYWVSRANSGENFPHDPARLFDTTVRVAALLYASLGGSNATDHALNPRKFRSVYWDTFSYSLYAHQLRRLRSLGFEHVGVMLSERFRVQPALAANAVWQWLGLPEVRYDAGDEGGHTYWSEYSRWTGHPMHKRAKCACMPCFPNGHHGKVAILPQTRELLDEVFRGEIAEIERLVPGLDLEKWWNVTL